MIVGVVGLGLIGGSMAKSIKSRTLHTVYGIDLDQETMTFARLCGAMDGKLTEETLPECDLILIALRPGAAVAWLSEHGGEISATATVIDLCGIKRAVVEPMKQLAEQYGFHYIGGHPMAGKERGGFVNSTDSLYVGASMILTPVQKTDINQLEQLKAFFTDLGFAGVTITNPEEHDRIIAFTSQLAHVVSNAYVRSPEAQRRRGFSAGSFRDMTRVARLDEDMWTELMMENRDFVVKELDVLIDHLMEYKGALEAENRDAFRALLKDGRECKASAGGN